MSINNTKGKKMYAKVSAIMLRNVLHSIAVLKRENCFVTFDRNGWATAKY